MLFKIHKCFGHLIDKFARFRHETIVKMENMSREEKFKAMKLPELKAYLQNRGITVNSYLKAGLIAIACAVEEMSLLLLFQVSEAQDQLNLSLRLRVHNIQLPDPFNLNDYKHSRPFGLFDISHIFAVLPHGNLGSLGTNLTSEKFLKFLGLFLSRVFLKGDKGDTRKIEGLSRINLIPILPW